MSRFIITDRKTDYLMPPSLEDWLNQDHLARFIVEVVDNLDLSNLVRQYAGRGSKAHHPATLLAILVYGYATGTFSSRKLERATYDSVAFRYIAAGSHPDHDTLATFRRRFLGEIEGLFVQVLEMASEMKLLKLGTVCLDGTKIHANASRHSALSHGHIETLETQLKAEVQELLALAEQADKADVPDGMNLPEELKRREDRLALMAVAKAKIGARAKERYKREKAEYDEKMAARAAKETASGKKCGGKTPAAPQAGPKKTDQVNLTDEESRIMPVAGGGFEQCYNAQAGVDVTVIRDYLGHASIATTNRYITTNLQMKRDVLEAFWRRARLACPVKFSSRMCASTAYKAPIHASACSAWAGSISFASNTLRLECAQHCAWVIPVFFAYCA